MKKIFKRFWEWLRLLFVKPKPEPTKTVIEVPWQPEHVRRLADYKKTKAYIDQRQKTPWNRSRHPSKRIRNTYKLKP